mgnify:CR=1 FL=1
MPEVMKAEPASRADTQSKITCPQNKKTKVQILKAGQVLGQSDNPMR